MREEAEHTATGARGGNIMRERETSGARLCRVDAGEEERLLS